MAMTRSVMHRALQVTIAVVGLLAVAACGGGSSSAVRPVLNRSADVVGTQISTVTFERFDGSVTSLEDYRGQLLVVNLFGNWCPTCVRELPEFEKVSRELEGRVTFVGISVTETVEQAAGLVARTGVTFDVGRDPTGRLLPVLGAVAMPATVFVDANGTVVGSVTAGLDAETLRATIEEVFGSAVSGTGGA